MGQSFISWNLNFLFTVFSVLPTKEEEVVLKVLCKYHKDFLSPWINGEAAE